MTKTTKGIFRTCNKCGDPKTVDDFYAHGPYIDRQCKTCFGKQGADWAKRNPEKKKQIRRDSARKRYAEDPLAFRRRGLKANYGITLEDYSRMLDERDNVCAVCKRPETSLWKGKVKPLSVDHCHTTKKVRGLLCVHCNQAIGLAKDDSDRFQALAGYLDARQNLPPRPRPLKRAKFDWLGGGNRPISDKECQLHCYRYRTYGITMVEFRQLVEAQENRCGVCSHHEAAKEHTSGKVRALAIDHDHESGAIRGLLCWRCNAVIGRMGDSAGRLRSAADYLVSRLGVVISPWSLVSCSPRGR